jgi:activator of 2-hydroxyglutaryl-CoA dehydratase
MRLAGIDVGSRSIKLAVLDSNGRMLDRCSRVRRCSRIADLIGFRQRVTGDIFFRRPTGSP